MLTSPAIRHALADHPGLSATLDQMGEAAWGAVDPVLLELCRLRIATLLDCRSEADVRTAAAGLDEAMIAELPAWPSSPRFDARQRACLAFCEQFVIDVAGMPDDLALAVVDHLGEAGARTFTAALLVVEQRQRLALALDRLFPERVE